MNAHIEGLLIGLIGALMIASITYFYKEWKDNKK